MKRRNFWKRMFWAAGPALLALTGCQGPVDPNAEQAFKQKLGSTSVTVFPAFIRHGADGLYDPNAAVKIAAFLNEQKLAQASASTVEVPLTGEWRINQAKMFRISAESFAAYVKANPIETDYALLPEYLMGGGGGVGGVHCYLVSRDGTLAFGILLNSHQKIFSDANPKTKEDCTGILLEALRIDLK